MHEPKYQLVLSGRLREGVELGQAAAALARLFRMPEQEAATLLTGRRSRIRRPLGRDLAERLCGKIQARGAQCRVEPVAQTPRREQPDDGDADDTMLIEVLADDASPDESSLIHPLREGPLPSPPVGGVQAPPVPPRIWSAFRPRRRWVVWAALPLCVGLWFLFHQLAEERSASAVSSQAMDLDGPATPEVGDPVAGALEEQTMLRLRQLGWVVKVWWIQRRGEGSELTDLAHLARDMGLELEALRDAWGREIRYQASDSRYQLISAGGDGRFDTGDDLRREGMFGS